MPSTQPRYAVHATHEAPARGRVVKDASFEAAAMHYLEECHPAADEDEVSVMVEDCETGERHCFRVDLETGEAAPR